MFRGATNVFISQTVSDQSVWCVCVCGGLVGGVCCRVFSCFHQLTITKEMFPSVFKCHRWYTGPLTTSGLSFTTAATCYPPRWCYTLHLMCAGITTLFLHLRIFGDRVLYFKRCQPFFSWSYPVHSFHFKVFLDVHTSELALPVNSKKWSGSF